MDQVITARPGLSVGGFNFALYIDGVSQSTAGLSITELTVDTLASNYKVSGLPTITAGNFYSLTWDDGIQRQVHRWPDSPAQPPNLVIPIRQSGVSLTDLDSHLYLDGLEVALGTLTLTSLGSPFDYLLSNLPTPPSESFYVWAYSWGAAYKTEQWPSAIAGYNIALPATSATSIIPDLLDCFGDIILVQPGNVNAFGTWTASGAIMALPCYIEGETRLVRDMKGGESLSTAQAYIAGYNSLTHRGHRYTLPSHWAPKTDLEAIAISKVSDESGLHHEVVMLP
jgi:hypothetical protein